MKLASVCVGRYTHAGKTTACICTYIGSTFCAHGSAPRCGPILLNGNTETWEKASIEMAKLRDPRPGSVTVCTALDRGQSAAPRRYAVRTGSPMANGTSK